jgi:hypothetical protein
VFSFASLGLLVAGVNYLRGPALGLLGGLFLLSSNAFQVQAPSQIADIPAAFYYLAATVLFAVYDHLPEARPGWATLAGVAAGLAVWTKNDAWVFLFAITAARLFIYTIDQDWRGYSREIIAFLAGLAPVMVFIIFYKLTLAHPNIMITEQGQATLPRLADSSRYGIILRAAFHQAYQLDVRRSTPFLFLLGLALFLGLDIHKISRRTRFTFVSLLGCLLAGFFFVYLITPVDLAWHLQTSLFRIALQIWPLAVFFMAMLLRFSDPAPNKDC